MSKKNIHIKKSQCTEYYEKNNINTIRFIYHTQGCPEDLRGPRKKPIAGSQNLMTHKITINNDKKNSKN